MLKPSFGFITFMGMIVKATISGEFASFQRKPVFTVNSAYRLPIPGVIFFIFNTKYSETCAEFILRYSAHQCHY